MILCSLLIVILSQYVHSQHNTSSGEETIKCRYLREQFRNLQNQFNLLQNNTYNQISNLEEKVSLLEKKNKELRDNITVNDQKVSRKGRKLTTMDNISELVKSNIVISIPQNSNSSSHVSDMQGKVTQLQDQVSSLNNEVEQLTIIKSNIKTLQNDNTEIKNNITTLQNNNVHMKDNITFLQNSNVQMKDVITTLESSNAQMKDNVTMLQNSNLQMKDVITTLKSSNSQMKDNVTTLQNSNLQMKDVITTLESSNSQMKDNVTTLQNSNMQMKDITTLLESSNVQMKDNITMLQSSNIAMKDNITTLLNSYVVISDNLLKLTTVHGKVINKTEKFSNAIKGNVMSLEKYHVLLRDNVTALKSATDIKITKLQNEIRTLYQGSELLRNNVTALSDTIIQLQHETESATNMSLYISLSMDSKIRRLENTDVELKNQNRVCESTVETLHREFMALKNNMETLKDNINVADPSTLMQKTKTTGTDSFKHTLTTQMNSPISSSAGSTGSLEYTPTQLQLDSATSSSTSTTNSKEESHLTSMRNPNDGVSNLPRDCAGIYDRSKDDGVYTIYPTGYHHSVQVYCEMSTDGGGWTVIQRRKDGSVNFNRNWTDYKKGFGNLTGEMWLGNDNIAAITSQKSYQLCIDLEDWEGETRNATYSEFKVGTESDLYKLSLGSFSSGTAEESLLNHNGKKFATYDRDNDGCAEWFDGGFWYLNWPCLDTNLNGAYQFSSRAPAWGKGVIWAEWLGHFYSLKSTTMKIRPTTLLN